MNNNLDYVDKLDHRVFALYFTFPFFPLPDSFPKQTLHSKKNFTCPVIVLSLTWMRCRRKNCFTNSPVKILKNMNIVWKVDLLKTSKQIRL